MGGGADVAGGVVEDEVFKMHELAVDPQRRTGVREILPLNPAASDRRTGDTLVQTRVSLLLCDFKPQNVIRLLELARRNSPDYR